MKALEDFVKDLPSESHQTKADIITFINHLKEAGKKIEKHYFQLDVACSEEPIFRERVYCYELYHRLRCELAGGCKPDDSYPYKLDGEVDKAGHPIVYPTLGSVKPDFIVHLPGSNTNNLAVIEVKPVTTKINGLEKDLRTLKGFLDLEKGKYQLAIMLVYGDGEHDLPDDIISKVRDAQRDYRSRILLLWHKGPGEIPDKINFE